MQEIGLFCGTFNPVHLGHLLIAESARDQFWLAKVIFVTSPSPPHRSDWLLDSAGRHELVKAAVKDNPRFEASSVEIERQGPSYTIDTIDHFATKYGSEARINLIIGGDNLMQLKTWHESERLISSCRILVVPRLRYINEDDDHLMLVGERLDRFVTEFPDAQVETVEFPGIAVSGSDIRKRVERGQSVLYMVPPEVNKLITENGYFKKQIAQGQDA